MTRMIRLAFPSLRIHSTASAHVDYTPSSTLSFTTLPWAPSGMPIPFVHAWKRLYSYKTLIVVPIILLLLGSAQLVSHDVLTIHRAKLVDHNRTSLTPTSTSVPTTSPSVDPQQSDSQPVPTLADKVVVVGRLSSEDTTWIEEKLPE